MAIAITGNPTGPKGVRSDKWQFSIDRGGKVERVVQAGERIIIKTPGGGGFGKRRTR